MIRDIVFLLVSSGNILLSNSFVYYNTLNVKNIKYNNYNTNFMTELNRRNIVKLVPSVFPSIIHPKYVFITPTKIYKKH